MMNRVERDPCLKIKYLGPLSLCGLSPVLNSLPCLFAILEVLVTITLSSYLVSSENEKYLRENSLVKFIIIMDNIKLKMPDFWINDENPVMPYSETLGWQLTQYGITEIHGKGITGKGIKIAVLDTGVDDHPDLVIVHKEDMTGTGMKDTSGHGTHCLGIVGARANDIGVRGVAPDAELYMIKVMSDGSGSLEAVVKGIKRAADLGVHIISMSFGTSSNVVQLEDACKYAASKGCILIAASGNSGTEAVSYPAKYDYCAAVGSSNKSGSTSSYTSYGSSLDILGPGEKILSTFKGGGYAILSGTSMATPWVAGVCALALQAGIPVTWDLLTKSCIDLLDPGYDLKSGFGILDPRKLLAGPPTEPVTQKIYEGLLQLQSTLSKLMEIVAPRP